MQVDEVLANLAVADMASATAWYERLFGRPADAEPMEGLAEWHFPGAGAVQVSLNPERAGRGQATLSMRGLSSQVEGAREQGVDIDPVDEEISERVALVTVADPDGNQLTLVEPK